VPLKLYNTRTRRVEVFEPLRPPHVRVYVCGMTPSAEAHLGHARSFLFFDVLRRYLIHLGYEVTYVQNVTDIDDRSIARAIQTGENWYDIVSEYYSSFRRSIHERLGVLPYDAEPYATQFVPQIVEMIAELVSRRYAYVTEDGVYYRVSKFPRYGALSNRNVQELQAGARIEVDEHKDDPLDFALWKFAKPGEPKWHSPWGDGRPGWHIECSAMSRALLDPSGEGFDIHGGGADLIFPHHENEIAQSEPLMAHPPMVNFWVHGALLLFDHRKMSKSIGNFEPLSQLLDRHDPQAIRLLFLQTGYSKPMNFTEESIAGAAVALDRLKKMWRSTSGTPGGSSVATPLMRRIEEALDDDMNTAVALSEVLSYDGADRGEFAYALGILGLEPHAGWGARQERRLPEDFLERARSNGLAVDGATPEQIVERAVALRAQARAQKQWAESDRLRDALASCGVALKDSKDGTTWTAAE
jgi:cysteinyl-tRNA synthetase